MKLTAFFAAAAAVIMLASTASAQTVAAVAVAQSQSADVTTALTFRSSNSSNSLSAKSVEEIANRAQSHEVSCMASMIPQAASVLTSEVSTQLSEISNGVAKSFSTSLLKGADVMDQRSITLKVTYEPRPIGGILNIRVDLVPVFAGIGGASRPAATRSTAMAVETVTQDAIQEIVNRLSAEIAGEFQASK